MKSDKDFQENDDKRRAQNNLYYIVRYITIKAWS